MKITIINTPTALVIMLVEIVSTTATTVLDTTLVGNVVDHHQDNVVLPDHLEGGPLQAVTVYLLYF